LLRGGEAVGRSGTQMRWTRQLVQQPPGNSACHVAARVDIPIPHAIAALRRNACAHTPHVDTRTDRQKQVGRCNVRGNRSREGRRKRREGKADRWLVARIILVGRHDQLASSIERRKDDVSERRNEHGAPLREPTQATHEGSRTSLAASSRWRRRWRGTT
jgi:hypothetical protein